jgi:tetratricopeptide (TPR) repeat protein
MRLVEQSPKKGFKLLKKMELMYLPNVDVYYNLGVALLHQNRLEDAQRYFEKSLQLLPECEYARDNLDFTSRAIVILSKKCGKAELEEMGTLLISASESGFFDLAIKIGNLMIEIDKGPGALNDLGLAFQHQQRYDKALECYDKALRIDPNAKKTLSNKALCLLVTDKLKEAEMLYRRVVKLCPDYLQAWYHLGYISVSQKKYDEALSYLDKALALSDEYYLAWFVKYQALTALKRTEEAKKCLCRAIDLNPDYAAQLALGTDKKIVRTNMHAKPV